MPSSTPEVSRNVHRQVRIASAILLLLPLCALASPTPVHWTAPKPVHRATPPSVPLKLPPDIVYSRVVHADSAVVFSHETHVEYESYRCTGCHPKLYHLLNPTHRATHREMDKGGSCGVCHDGKHAFAVRDTESCVACHTGRQPASGGVADSLTGHAVGKFKGPKPFVFKIGKDSPGAVTFKHATHLGKSLTCHSCHPRPFSMKGTAPLSDGAMHEPSACGMCHDGKHSFSVEDDDKCDKCHIEGKGGK